MRPSYSLRNPEDVFILSQSPNTPKQMPVQGRPSAVSAGCTLRIAPDGSTGNHLTTLPSAQANLSPS